jgi:hypothetical protein
MCRRSAEADAGEREAIRMVSERQHGDGMRVHRGSGEPPEPVTVVVVASDAVARTTAAGVWLLATIVAFGLWAAVALAFFTIINDDYLPYGVDVRIGTMQPWQLVVSLVFAVALTAVSWFVARRVAVG